MSKLSSRRHWVPWPSPCPFSRDPPPHSAEGPHFPSLPVAGEEREEALLSFISLPRFNSTWVLAFLSTSLHAWAVSAYSSQVTCPCSHFLYASFFCVLTIVMDVFIHAALLPHLVIFLEKEVIPRSEPDFLVPSSLQHGLSRDSSKQIPVPGLLSWAQGRSFLPCSLLPGSWTPPSQSLQPRLPVTFISLTRCSLFIRIRSDRASSLVSSLVTCVRKLPHSRSFLDCCIISMLSLQQIPGWFKPPSEDRSLWNGGVSQLP